MYACMSGALAGSAQLGQAAADRLDHGPDDTVQGVTFTSPLAETLAPDLLERFLRYVRIDTQSERDRKQSPSTPGQLDLARLLVDELQRDRARPTPRSTTTAT